MATWSTLAAWLLVLVAIPLAAAVFIAPYFFLSAFGGELADRYDKARVAQWLKFAEIFVAALAALGYARHRRGQRGATTYRMEHAVFVFKKR